MNMQFPQGAYDPKDTGGFDPLPPDDYVAQIIEAVIAPPKSGDGFGLNLKYVILEGEFTERIVFQTVSFIHSKPGAQYYGRRMLDSIIAATGADVPLDSAEKLIFIPVVLTLSIEKGNEQYPEDKNRVVKVSPLNNNEAAEAAASKPTPPKPTPPKPTPTAPAAGGSKPWQRGK